MLASAERRNNTGRWKTMAWRRGACGGSGALHATRPDVAKAQENAFSRAVRPDDHRPRTGIERKRDAVEDAALANIENDILEMQRQQRQRRAHIHPIHP